MAYVYRHIRLDKNEPFYIGIGSDSTFHRANTKHGRNKIWKDIVAKTDYEVEILFNDLLWEDACKKEIEFVLLYGKIVSYTGTLANLTNGGDGTIGYKHPPESKVHLPKIMSEDTKRKISEACKNPSAEIRAKISHAGRGRIVSQETRNKKAEKHRGRKNTEETKVKMSESAKNRSAEYNRNLSLFHPNKKEVINTETGEKFHSIAEAARVNNLDRRTLNYQIQKGKSKFKNT